MSTKIDHVLLGSWNDDLVDEKMREAKRKELEKVTKL